MKAAVSNKIYTVDEYVQEELRSAVRHQFVDGQLFELAGEKRLNNIIAGFFYLLFTQSLKKAGYYVCINDVKIAIPGGAKYYYPDVFVTKEKSTEKTLIYNMNPKLLSRSFPNQPM